MVFFLVWYVLDFLSFCVLLCCKLLRNYPKNDL